MCSGFPKPPLAIIGTLTFAETSLYKYIEGSFNSDKKDFILEPLCVVFRLSLLQYKDKGTKLSIKNNSIQYQDPSYDQGLIRMMAGDCHVKLQ